MKRIVRVGSVVNEREERRGVGKWGTHMRERVRVEYDFIKHLFIILIILVNHLQKFT